jgi:glyoxylase-like metal-dependent hydrolase (beta-lactamase superfamily II)
VAHESRVHLSRRQFLTRASGVGVTLSAGAAFPAWHEGRGLQTVHKAGGLEVLVVSDGHFFLPTHFLIAPDSPPSERQAVLKAGGHTGDQIQLTNNVAVIRARSDVILVDAGAGPRHQPTAGKLTANLESAGIQPADVTTVVLTHAHPDHLWGVLGADDKPMYPNASYVISARELEVWSDPDVLRSLPTVLQQDRIVSGARNHLTRIRDKVRTVRGGDEIVSGVRVLDTPGHTQGHISLELAGGDGLLIGADALTHALVSFQHPSWKAPVDHEGERGVATRLRLLDRLATDKMRLLGAHLPAPGVGLVEGKDGAYRFVPV